MGERKGERKGEGREDRYTPGPGSCAQLVVEEFVQAIAGVWRWGGKERERAKRKGKREFKDLPIPFHATNYSL